MKAIVNIKLKEGVLDPAGKAVHHALTALKFSNVSDVRVGKQIVLDIDESDEVKARENLVTMCEELLANTVIEDYEIEILS
jgi:phosphoribosylformylglycinamidine synthase